MSNPCSKSPQTPCGGLFCPEDRTYLGLTVQKDGNEEVTESFCVSTWTPDQFAALRAFIAAGAVPVQLDDLKRITAPHLRLFHLVHTVFGPDLVTHFYARTTIRDYKRTLRKAGFNYPRYRRYCSAEKDVFLRAKPAPAVAPIGGAGGVGLGAQSAL